MKKLQPYLPQAVAYLFILLFIYAAVSKMLDFENFRVQMGQSPLLSAWAGFISYTVIATELLICVLLINRSTQLTGLYISFTLMLAFTVYIGMILYFSDFIPCSCGGILEEMGWTEHLIFNIALIVLAAVAIWISERHRLTPNRRIAVYLCTLSVAALGLLVTLFYSSEHIFSNENNFTRKFLQNPVSEVAAVTLAVERPYFAGVAGERIFTGNIDRPLLLTGITQDLTGIATLRIRPERMSEIAFRNVRVQVLTNCYYVYDGTVPVIYTGTLDNPEAKIISKGDAFFTQLSVLDTARFVLRTQSSRTHRYTLALLNLNRLQKVVLYDRLLEPQIDGVFDVDGVLQANDSSVVYAYSYRNQFMVMDRNMNLQHRLNTIDTTTNAKISVTDLKDGSRRMDAPPFKVNENFALFGNTMFNLSNLRGANESSSSWKDNHVIDLYRTDIRHYLGSLKIPKTREEPLFGFLFTAHNLFVLQGSKLRKFRYTEKFRKLITTGKAENP